MFHRLCKLYEKRMVFANMNNMQHQYGETHAPPMIFVYGSDASKDSPSRMQAGCSSNGRQDQSDKHAQRRQTAWRSLENWSSGTLQRCKLGAGRITATATFDYHPPDKWPTVRLRSHRPTCGANNGAIQCTSFCKLLLHPQIFRVQKRHLPTISAMHAPRWR